MAHVPDQLVARVSNTACSATVSSTTPSPAPRCPPVSDTALIVSERSSSRQLVQLRVAEAPCRSAGRGPRSRSGVIGRSSCLPPAVASQLSRAITKRAACRKVSAARRKAVKRGAGRVTRFGGAGAGPVEPQQRHEGRLARLGILASAACPRASSPVTSRMSSAIWKARPSARAYCRSGRASAPPARARPQAAHSISAPVLPACSRVIASRSSGVAAFSAAMSSACPAPCRAPPPRGPVQHQLGARAGVGAAARVGQLEGQRLQRVAGQHRGGLVPLAVHGGPAAAQVVVVHAGQVVVHQAVGVHRLDRRGGPDRAVGPDAVQGRRFPAPGTRAVLAARAAWRIASPTGGVRRTAVGLTCVASRQAGCTCEQRACRGCKRRRGNVTQPFDRLGARRVAVAVKGDRGDLFLGLLELGLAAFLECRAALVKR